MALIMTFVCGNGKAETKNLAANSFVTALMGQYKFLSNDLQQNQFSRPLVLQSSESNDALKGEVYAVLDYPFVQVNSALNNPEHWCDVLILHINVKFCQAKNVKQAGNIKQTESSEQNTVLNINLGKKYDQPLLETYRAKFNYASISNAANYFSVELKAADGPLGTKDYRIWVEATPISQTQTFLHFTYTYSFGVTGRLAMKSYLATIGKDKMGFSMAPTQSNGEVNPIQGVRGVVERNTMRYYLAIDAYLAALKEPPKNQAEARFDNWFNSTELYAKQLHEVEKDDYIKMKRKELLRQQVNVSLK